MILLNLKLFKLIFFNKINNFLQLVFIDKL